MKSADTEGRRLIAAMNRAGRLAARHRAELDRVSELFVDRYQVHYSDVDLDDIIDWCDTGLSSGMTLAQLDEFMRRSGYGKL